jgi:perosamine synthetase
VVGRDHEVDAGAEVVRNESVYEVGLVARARYEDDSHATRDTLPARLPRIGAPVLRASIPIHRPSAGEREAQAVAGVLESGWLGSGPVAEAFEARIAELTGAAHVVAVSSGSAALHLAVLALGLEPGDEVVLPSLTHVACAQVVRAAGGTVVFADVELGTAGLDPADVARRIGPRTRALMPVHYAGFPCRMDELIDLARDHGLAVVEDAAHAFGSTYRGRPIGSIGDLTCFSFDPVKNVTCGEGGAVATGDAELATAVRAAANLGVANDSWRRRTDARPWEYEATGPGVRYQLSDVNAAIGLAQLDGLDEAREHKRALLRRYREGLAEIEGIQPLEGDLDTAYPFLCVARVVGGLRDALADHLARDGVQAWVHFVPCHHQRAFSSGDALPVTDRLSGELLSLPLHHGLTGDDVEAVLDSVRAFFA